MRNIIKDIKAGAVPIVAVLIILVIIIAGIVFYIGPGGSSSTSYWETKNEFGTWQDEITIVYEDGTTTSLKMLQENIGNPLTVSYEGKAITKILMKLTAKVTGTGYDGAEITAKAMGYDVSITWTGGSKPNLGFSPTGTDVYNVAVGSTCQLAYRELTSSYLEGTGP